jgi:hypothetical protein
MVLIRVSILVEDVLIIKDLLFTDIFIESSSGKLILSGNKEFKIASLSFSFANSISILIDILQS